MDEKLYTVTLSDGTVIENLALNGTNFVSQTPLSKDIFEDNLFDVVISDLETEEVHPFMELANLLHFNDGYYFTIRDYTESELKEKKRDADIDYLMMMVG